MEVFGTLKESNIRIKKCSKLYILFKMLSRSSLEVLTSSVYTNFFCSIELEWIS